VHWIAIAVAAACACRSAPVQEPVATTTRAPRPVVEPRKVEIVTETRVELLDPIRFVPGSATFEVTSIPMLDAVARTLAGNPSIKRVAVQAFGPDTAATFQAKLGATRAQAIVDALVARGVEPIRLVADGGAQPPAGLPNVPTFSILERAP
jgi:outer membrane protein OmpA-like peptidoglycan-associated protein